MINTKGLTTQQVIDEIARALIKQGEQCYSPEANNCLYGDGDKHCAVGFLLPPDNKEMMEFEGDVECLAQEFDNLGLNDYFIRTEILLLSLIQVIHDSPIDRIKYHIKGINTFRPELDTALFNGWYKIRGGEDG